MSATPPPRLAVWLLARRLSPEWREFVLGDLEEALRTERFASPRAARRWFWWQTVRCLVAPPPRPQRDSPRALSSSPQGDSPMRALVADVRYGFRLLRRSPAFALAVIAVLGLGIGANTAIFSIVNAVLLRPLPFETADRLVRVYQEPPQSTFPGIHRFAVSAGNFYDWKRDARAFERLAIYRFRQFALTGTGGQAEAIMAGAVGADFFELLHAQPALGRVFREAEDKPGQSHVAILSERFWHSHFGGARDAVGRTLTLDGEAYTIVGVMPASFTFAAWEVTARDIWVPLAYTDAQRAVRDNHNALGIARLKPDVDLTRAQAEMDVIAQRQEAAFPNENTGWGVALVPLQEVIVGDIRPLLLMLLGAVALVLLVACANVGNLLFARALTRRKELAIRAALGAGRARVFQQLLIEALVLALTGGAAGLLIANVGLQLAATLLANQLPRGEEISIDARVLVFVLAASAVTGIIAGTLPALRAGRTDLNDALKDGGRHEGVLGLRTRRLLVVCEVALSLVLLMHAGVMLRSLAALRYVDTGFDSTNVLTFVVSLPDTRYGAPGRASAFFSRALERLRTLPGVEAAGAIDNLPLQGGSVQPVVLEGEAERAPRDQPTTNVRKITPGYLRAMHIPVLRGRDVAPGDTQVLLVSQSAAKLLWRDADPIGRRITLPLQSRMITKQVIGIVGDTKQDDLSGAPGPTVYEYSHDQPWTTLTLVLRSSVPPRTLTTSAASVIHALDPEQPVQDMRTMDDVLEETLTARRFSALLLGLFAAVALTLASVGIYSVLSYIVRGRSREIGIRAALGAQTTDVVRLVVAEGMTPAVIGIVIGAVAALGSVGLLKRLVFGVSPSDPVTLVAVACGLAAVALIASVVPAYRASRLDPLKVLRES